MAVEELASPVALEELANPVVAALRMPQKTSEKLPNSGEILMGTALVATLHWSVMSHTCNICRSVKNRARMASVSVSSSLMGQEVGRRGQEDRGILGQDDQVSMAEKSLLQKVIR